MDRVIRTFFFILLQISVILPLSAQGYQVKTIVIDAGHGGKDPGAVGRKAKEKDINLQVALMTGKYIEKYLPDVKVLYTRKSDVFVGLADRSDFANKNKADLFVSIHVNAVGNSGVTGASTWLLGTDKNPKNLELAKLENSVIELEENFEEKYEGFDPNKDESYIVFNFNSTKANFDQSLELAQELQSQFTSRVGRRNYGIQQGPFWVLVGTTMPSVLVELGFITNPGEEKFLMSTQGQEYMASAIFRAVRSYKQKIEGKNSKVIVEKITKEKSAQRVETVEANLPTTTYISNTSENDLVFKVQFFISKSNIPIDDTRFDGMSKVWQYEGGGYYKYTTGESTDLDDMVALQRQIKEKYPDAFVVAIKNGVRIPLKEAKELINK